MQIIIPHGDFSDSLKTNSGTSYGHPNAKGAASVASAYCMATPRYNVKKNIEIESVQRIDEGGHCAKRIQTKIIKHINECNYW